MSQALPVPYDCVRCPTECSPTQVPGAQGEPGANGTNGTDGINAFTVVTADFVMPAIGGTVVAEVESTAWMVGEQGAVYGQALAIEFAGTLLITAIVDATHVTIINLGYTGNAVPGSTIPAGARVGASGVEGPSGAAPSGVLLSANNLSDVTDVPTARSNLGLGTASQAAAGDFFAVANNLSEGVGATKRTNLGLGTVAVEDAGIGDGDVAKNDGALTPGDSLWATASGQETKSAADAKTALGIAGQVGAYILCRDIHASGTGAQPFNTGSDIDVPMSTLSANTAGVGVSLAAGILTLPAGVYRVRASVPGFQCGLFQAWLYNNTNNVIEFRGTIGSSDVLSADTSYSFISGRLTVSGAPSKDYKLQARCAATGSFGASASFGDEVYACWELEQES